MPEPTASPPSLREIIKVKKRVWLNRGRRESAVLLQVCVCHVISAVGYMGRGRGEEDKK